MEKPDLSPGWSCLPHLSVSVCSPFIFFCFFSLNLKFISCVNLDFSTSLDGNPTLWAICCRCHISLLKINIAAVERRHQGGRERDGERLLLLKSKSWLLDWRVVCPQLIVLQQALFCCLCCS